MMFVTAVLTCVIEGAEKPDVMVRNSFRILNIVVFPRCRGMSEHAGLIRCTRTSVRIVGQADEVGIETTYEVDDGGRHPAASQKW